ncbi:MAG: hypothetical protein ABRQ24_07110 [Syntrophomonadaceae bacterium]
MDGIITEQLLAKLNQDIWEFAEVLQRPSPERWFIRLKKLNFTGFIMCEDNVDDIITPTIRIGILVADISGISRQHLLELFALNGQFHACTLSVESLEDKWELFINRRIPVESYHYGELEGYTMVMLEWFSIFQERIDGILS